MSVSAGPSAMSNSAKNHYLAGHYLVLVRLPSANSLRRPESGIAGKKKTKQKTKKSNI